MTEFLQHYVVHIGYALMLVALLARDVLWLRSILVVSQSVLAWYAVFRGVLPIASWNLVLVLINAVWVMRILRERAAVELPADLRPLYEAHFAALSPPEFLRFWSGAERRAVRDTRFVEQGGRPDGLYYVLRGEVEIRQNGEEIARCVSGNFVGEMSLLTGKPATADAVAAGEVELVRWPAEPLARLRERNPVFWTKVQSVIGHDLVEKVLRASEAA